MPGNELSLDEIYAPTSAPSEERFIDPKAQAGREEEARQILQAEYQDPRKADSREAVKKEYQRRFPGKSLKDSQELSLGDLYGEEKAPSAPTGKPQAPTKPEMPTSIWGKVQRIGKDGAREVAQIGDMILSTPGGLIGSIAGFATQGAAEAAGLDHREAGVEGKQKADTVSEKLSTHVFSNLLAQGVPEGEEVNSTHVEKALGWLQEKIDKGAEFIDAKTGGRLTKEEVQQEAAFFMNLVGTKGLAHVGGKLLTKDGKLAVEPKQAKEGLPHEAEEPAAAAPEKAADTAAKVEKIRKKDEGLNSPKPPPKLYDRLYENLKTDTKPIIKDAGWEKAKEAFRKGEIKDGEGLQGFLEGENVARKFSNKEAGGVTWDHMRNLAGLSLGFAAGAYIDPENPIVAGFVGAILGGGTAAGALKGGAKIAKDLTSRDSRVRINAMTEEHEHLVESGARRTWQSAMDVLESLPSKADREEVYRAIDEGKVPTLSPEKQKAAIQAQKFFDEAGQLAVKHDVIESLRENYVTHMWDKEDAQKVRSLFDPKPIGAGMSPLSPFDNARRFATVKEGKAAGLKPITEDLAEVMSKYGDSVYRSIANKVLLDRLKGAATEGGDRLLRPAGKAPGNYVAINHPSLARYRVHPDIAPSLRFMYEAQDAHGIMAGLSMLNTALKRNAVSFSLFHAKALMDAMLGAVNNPLSVGKVLGQAALPKVFGQNRYLEQLRHGGAGDLVDNALRDGLKFTFEGKESIDSDVGGGFYKTLKSVQTTLDAKFGKVAGLPIRGYVRINHAFDNFMWARLHTAMKLEIYAAKREALMQNTAKTKNPLSQEAAGKIAASYANYVFGGINWQRIAEGVHNRFGRDLALNAFSPRGRRGLQLLMFAPDWTISTSMAFAKAFGRGSGVKGIFSAKTSADLFRQQLLRSAFWYVLIGDALNHHFTDHHLWDKEQKDPFYVELGDGRKMQLSKHFTEPFHWFTRPGQQAMNKLGTVPSEALEQFTNKEYLSTKGAPPIKDRGRHLAKRFVPIGAGQFDNGVGSGVSGALGFPIYGRTPEQRAADRRAKREEAFKRRLEEYKKHAEANEPQKGGGQR